MVKCFKLKKMDLSGNVSYFIECNFVLSKEALEARSYCKDYLQPILIGISKEDYDYLLEVYDNCINYEEKLLNEISEGLKNGK